MCDTGEQLSGKLLDTFKHLFKLVMTTLSYKLHPGDIYKYLLAMKPIELSAVCELQIAAYRRMLANCELIKCYSQLYSCWQTTGKHRGSEIEAQRVHERGTYNH